ncbi:MAG: hypothetical protein E7171_00425 [Firmicutes bacterium]|nr:hypothetical protein [Bacillota bacterium]
MKKRVIIILSYFIVAILFCLIGFCIGINMDKNNNDKQIAEVVGIYHSDNWNNREDTLILNKDYTCKYPGNITVCSWSINGAEITIQLQPSKIDDGIHIATLVDNGIILHDHHFEKVG